MMYRSLFADRLRSLRKDRHMTQDDVAQWLNIHRTTYTKYETDKATPSQDCLIELSRLFHVSTDYLLGKEDTDQPMTDSVEDESGGDITLSNEELMLIQYYRMLEREDRRTTLQKMIEIIDARRNDHKSE